MIFKSKKRPACAARGFTLGEILIVIAVIGILSSIIWAYLGSARIKSRDGQRIADIKQLSESIEVYFSNCNTYPTTLSQLTSDCTGSSILPTIPVDPKNVNPNIYKYFTVQSPTLQYHVCATMELVTTNGLDKSKHAKINSFDPCNGNTANVYDKYGP